MSSKENKNSSSKKLFKNKSKLDKNAITNVGNQICKVIIPQLSPAKSSIKKKSNEENKKTNKNKTGKKSSQKSSKYSTDLSFKDLNNHFNGNQLNSNSKSNDNDLEEKICRNEQNFPQFIGVDLKIDQQKSPELDR